MVEFMQWDLTVPAVHAVSEAHVCLTSASLNVLKSGISDLSPDQALSYRAAAAWVNPYEKLNLYAPCQLISRAYFKLWEMMIRFPPHTSDRLATLHLCEAPGSFVQATEVYWTSHLQRAPNTWTWHGVTLPPEEKVALPWKVKGPVILANVITDSLPPTCYNSNMVTGDGGFDVETSQLDRQEELNHTLFAAQVTKAIETCLVGGNIYIKLFDMFNTETQLFLNAEAIPWFEHAYIYKPLGSRICSSERFFVGVRRRKSRLDANHLERIREVSVGLVSVQSRALNIAIRMAQTMHAKDIWDRFNTSAIHRQNAERAARVLLLSAKRDL